MADCTQGREGIYPRAAEGTEGKAGGACGKKCKARLEKDRERIARDEARTVGAVRQIAQLLDLPMLDRMEAFDISNISGFENVRLDGRL